MNNNKYIPLLRFPEFQNDGEWGKKQLKDFLVEHKTKSDGKAEVYSVSVSKGVVNQIEYLGRSFSAKDTTNYKLVKPNDIIYTKSPTGAFPFGIIKQSFVKHNVIVSPLYAVFTPINKYIGFIIHSYFESPIRINNYLLPIIQKGAKNTIQISNTTFLSNGVCFPSELKEQRKIAECLLSLDNYIDVTKRKLEQLKEYKKGLMQKLFPAKGKTLSELRFPEFSHRENWNIVSIGEVTEVVNKRNKSNRILPVYSINNVDGFIPQSQQFDGMDSEARGYDISAYKIIGKHTFAYNPARINVGSIGYSRDLKDILISSLYVCFKTTDIVDDTFLMCFFNSHIFNQAVECNVEGGIRSYLFYENFSRIKLAIPKLDEQKRIASCIMSIDCEIKKINDKIDLLETHKKGLQQQLFPRFK